MKKHLYTIFRHLFAAALLMSSTMSAWAGYTLCSSSGSGAIPLGYTSRIVELDPNMEYMLSYTKYDGEEKFLTFGPGIVSISHFNTTEGGVPAWTTSRDVPNQKFKVEASGTTKTCDGKTITFYNLYNEANDMYMQYYWNVASFVIVSSVCPEAENTPRYQEIVLLCNANHNPDDLYVLSVDKWNQHEICIVSNIINPSDWYWDGSRLPPSEYELGIGYFRLYKFCSIVTYDANGGSGAPDPDEDFCPTGTITSTIPTKTNYLFMGWNTKQDGSGTPYKAGDALTLSNDLTLYAQWEIDNTIDISAHRWDDNRLVFTTEDEVPTDFDAITINYNGNAYSATQSKSGDYYMITASSLNLSAQSCLPFNIQWKKDGDVMKQATIKSPIFVLADSTNLNWSSEILASAYIKVATGATLNLTDDYTIGDVDISEGAKLRVEGATLAAGHMHLRGGLIDEYNYLMPQVYVGSDASVTTTNKQIYYYLNIDAESYYPFGVPFSTNVGDIRYMAKLGASTSSQIGKNKAIDIATYDGESRANLALTTTKYWSPLTASDVLVPGVGYIISAKRLKNETYAGLRFTMNVPDEWLTLGEQTSITIDETTFTRNVVSVGAWQNANTHIGHWGWNYVANPYLVDVNGFTANFLTDAGDQIRYLTIPSFRFEDYYQIPTAIGTVESFNGFFVQVGGTSSTITFDQDLRQRTPARYASAMEKEQQIYISVSDNTESDLMGLIINDRFTADYDFNADLVKELVEGGTSLRCYMRYNDFNMAYLAINKTLLDDAIPVAVRFPQDGYYTFSLNEHSITNNMKAVYLYDKTTDSTTDLLSADYNFQSEKGVVTDRFALFAVSESSEVPTFINNADDGSTQTPEKFIYNGHLYFSHGGMIFDGQGKCVK